MRGQLGHQAIALPQFAFGRQLHGSRRVERFLVGFRLDFVHLGELAHAVEAIQPILTHTLTPG